MKKFKIGYYISTGLLTLLMLMSASMYFFNHDSISTTFENLGYPTHIIYPLAVAKLLGLVAIWTRFNESIKEWAYAGFFFNFLLATMAHLSIGDGEHLGGIIALVLLSLSYTFHLKIFEHKKTISIA